MRSAGSATDRRPVQVAVICQGSQSGDPEWDLNQTILTFTRQTGPQRRPSRSPQYDDILVEKDHFTWLRHWVEFQPMIPTVMFAGFLKVNITDNEAPGVLIVESDGVDRRR